MLVPLDTFAGWPASPDPTAVQVLGLLVGIPALIFAAIFLLGKASSLAKAGRGSEGDYTTPVLLGSSSQHPMLGSGGSMSMTAIESGGSTDRPLTPNPAASEAVTPLKETGGASVRW